MGEWTSTKERLPKENVEVIACLDCCDIDGRRIVELGLYRNCGMWLQNNGDDLGAKIYGDDEVLYWMEKPEPPNGKPSTEQQLKHALALMWFAYENKDGDVPHKFETDALQETERLLGKWEECMQKYLRDD